MSAADGEARERRKLVRVGLVLVLMMLFAWLALEGGPPFIRALFPPPEPGQGLAERTRREASGLSMYIELLAWEGDDLAIVVCVEKTDPDREPLWMGNHRSQFRVRFWDEQGKKLTWEADRAFSFPDHFIFAEGVRLIQPLVVRPPAEARSLVIYWGNTGCQTRSVSIPLKPGSLPRWVDKLFR